MNRTCMTPMLVVLTLVAGAATGCVTVYQRDPATIASFQRAIDNRRADWQRFERELSVPTPTARDLRGLKMLNDSEIDRLTASKFREEQKADSR